MEENGRVWAVPKQLGLRRDVADGLAQAWANNIGSCTAVYARSEEGKRLLMEAWKSGGNNRFNLDVIETWE